MDMTLAWIAKDQGLIPTEALVFYPTVTFCVCVCVWWLSRKCVYEHMSVCVCVCAMAKVKATYHERQDSLKSLVIGLCIIKLHWCRKDAYYKH